LGDPNGYIAQVQGGANEIGLWYHIVGVYDGANAILYVNGVQVASEPLSRPFDPNPGETTDIGYSSAFGRNINASVDECAIYPSVLSPAEILAHYQNGTNASPAIPYNQLILAQHPVGYWRLNEFPDDSSGNNGLITHDYRGAHNGYYSNAVINVAGYNPTYDVDTATAFDGGGANSLVDGIRDLSFEKSAGSSQFSIEAWVLGGNQTTDAGIVSKGYNGVLNAGTGTGTEQFVLDVTGGNPRKFRFLVRDAAGNGHVAQSGIVPYDPIHLNSMWHHLVGVCDQTNGFVYLYVDGLLAGTGSIANNVGVLSQALPMTIGARRTGGGLSCARVRGGSRAGSWSARRIC
jgi:hypothetical protein